MKRREFLTLLAGTTTSAFPPAIHARPRALHGNRILARIESVLPAAREARFDRLTLGFRPMPTDDRPIVGPIPGAPDVFVTVTHSGVTLAPILGRYVTREIVDGEPVGTFTPYRPARFSARAADPLTCRCSASTSG